MFGTVLIVWGIGMAGYTIYNVINKSSKGRIKVFNVSDRAIKHKKFQASISDKSKGMFK